MFAKFSSIKQKTDFEAGRNHLDGSIKPQFGSIMVVEVEFLLGKQMKEYQMNNLGKCRVVRGLRERRKRGRGKK